MVVWPSSVPSVSLSHLRPIRQESSIWKHFGMSGLHWPGSCLQKSSWESRGSATLTGSPLIVRKCSGFSTKCCSYHDQGAVLGRGGDSTPPHTFRSVWGERTHTEIRKEERGIPGEPVFNNPPSNAGDAGSIPGQGTKIPHTTGQLSLHATTKPWWSQINLKKEKKERRKQKDNVR